MIAQSAFTESKLTTPVAVRNGWKEDPRAVEDYLAKSETPVFGVAAECMRRSARVTRKAGQSVLFWDAELAIFGRTLAAHRQTIGDCVSHGWARALQMLKLRQIALLPISQEEKQKLAIQIATEPMYAFSRVEVGRGRLGRGDGSIGAWASEAAVKYGCLERKSYESVDLTTYSGSRAKSWGMPGAGVPDVLEPEARLHIARNSALVTSADEAEAALSNWYPIPVCSNQGFTTTRDQYGFCKPRGTWAHCMLLDGICEALNGTTYDLSVPIQQSWGNSPNGPNRAKLKDRGEIELPQGVFLVPMETVASRMLSRRDSFAVSDIQGFVPRMPVFTF